MKKYLVVVMLTFVTSAAGRGLHISYKGEPPLPKVNLSLFPSDTSKIVDSIVTVLQNGGYLDADVTRNHDSIAISAGPRFILDTLILTGDTSLSIYPNVTFAASAVNPLLDSIVTAWKDRGYLYATLTVGRVQKHSDAVTMNVVSNHGPRMFVQGLEFSGLKRTDPNLVRRYLPSDSEVPVTPQLLRKLSTRASDVPFAVFQPPIRIRPLPGYTGGILQMDFVEPRQVNIEGGGGYLPGDHPVFVWNLKLDFKNPFGGGRNFSVFSEKRETRRQTLDVSYSQPLFLIGKGTIGGSVATRDYRDQFYEFAASGSYKASLTPDFTTGFELEGRSVEPATETPSYNSYSAAFSISRSTVSGKLNPRSGLAVSWKVGFDFRSYGGDSVSTLTGQTSFNEVRNDIRADYYQKVARDLLIHLGLGYHGLETAEQLPPISELYFVGGPGTVRGFRNEQYTAIRTGLGTVEPRYRFGTGYFFLFYDGAYMDNRILNDNEGVASVTKFINGYGFGMAAISSLRSVRLSLGWNPDIPFDQPQFSVEFSSSI